MMWMALAGIAAAMAVGLIVRRTRRTPSPCPWWARFVLENPYMDAVAGPLKILARLNLEPGMKVLDVGCGPGRLTIPLARRVGPHGRVVALDMQKRMLDMLRSRLRQHDLTNVETIHGGAGQGALSDEGVFDRAVLVTVLGEIRDKESALREIYQALRPGGVLSVTEALPDPDYQTAGRIISLGGRAGFTLERKFGTPLAFTVNLRKPGLVER